MMSPAAAKLLLAVAVLAGVLTALGFIGYQVYQAGAASVQAQWDVEKAEMARDHAEEVARLESFNRKVEVRYMDRVQVVRIKADTVVREVPVYVTREDAARCPIPDGFMLVRHAAIEGHVPDDYDPRDFEGAGETVDLVDVAENEAINFGICHENATRLNALVEWAEGISR